MTKRNTIAIIYDFDGTLSPAPMQEYTVLPEIGIKPNTFWAEVKAETLRARGEEIITYMMLMLDRANTSKVSITRTNLGRLASRIRFFPGVATFFTRINTFVNAEFDREVHVRHYIISSGLKEILTRVSIKKYFYNVFASEYAYDHNGVARYPKLVINDTIKTQFLFRINKGREELSESINEYMHESERPIPFSNIVYIGDGFTDVPCMTVATKNGGYAIAVYRPKQKKGLATCQRLFEAGRVEFIAPADYRRGHELETCLKTILRSIGQSIYHHNQQYKNIRKHVKRRNRERQNSISRKRNGK